VQPGSPTSHSERNAINGSTRVARQAGRRWHDANARQQCEYGSMGERIECVHTWSRLAMK
jgi:hypothetical protein